MAPSGFSSLPLEVQNIIIDLIQLPSDLKSLCLASRSFQQLAIPRLYSRFVVDLDNQRTPWLTTLLNQENLGIAHIRHMLIQHKQRGTQQQEKEKAGLVHAALALLHPNTLLSYGSNESVLLQKFSPVLLSSVTSA